MNFISADWPAPENIKAYTTTRNSWGWENQPKKDAAATQQLCRLLQLPSEPIWLTQTHTAIAVEASADNKDINADASYTAMPHHVCVILTADCLPLLICNKQGTQIAAIHAGWRGLLHGIIENTINKLEQPHRDLLVWLGPAIGPQKFEVGADVYHAFTQQNAHAAAAFQPIKQDKWLANLYALAKIRLQQLGVTQIYGGQYCTHTQSDLFYSYRRDGGKTGRMASVIWIEE